MQQMMFRLARLVSITILISLTALLLQACGNEDDNGDDGDNDSAAQTTSSVAVGEPAPAFSLPAVDQGEVALADFVGNQPVLLYFHMAVG